MAEFWNIDRLDLWKGLAVRTAVFKSARICSLGFDQYGMIIRVIDWSERRNGPVIYRVERLIDWRIILKSEKYS